VAASTKAKNIVAASGDNEGVEEGGDRHREQTYQKIWRKIA